MWKFLSAWPEIKPAASQYQASFTWRWKQSLSFILTKKDFLLNEQRLYTYCTYLSTLQWRIQLLWLWGFSLFPVQGSVCFFEAFPLVVQRSKTVASVQNVALWELVQTAWLIDEVMSLSSLIPQKYCRIYIPVFIYYICQSSKWRCISVKKIN